MYSLVFLVAKKQQSADKQDWSLAVLEEICFLSWRVLVWSSYTAGLWVVCFIISFVKWKEWYFISSYFFVMHLGLQMGPVLAVVTSNLFVIRAFSAGYFDFPVLCSSDYSEIIKGQVVFQRARTPSTHLFWTFSCQLWKELVFWTVSQSWLVTVQLCFPCGCLGWGARKTERKILCLLLGMLLTICCFIAIELLRAVGRYWENEGIKQILWSSYICLTRQSPQRRWLKIWILLYTVFEKIILSCHLLPMCHLICSRIWVGGMCGTQPVLPEPMLSSVTGKSKLQQHPTRPWCLLLVTKQAYW